MTPSKPFSLWLLVALALTPTSGHGHESPIDHVERELQLFAGDGRVRLVYRLLSTERAALMELRAMDVDGDGSISLQERDAFWAGKGRAIAKSLELTIGDRSLALEPDGGVRCDPQLGQTFVFTAPWPALAPGRHPGKLVDGHSRNYPGGFVWKSPGQGGSEAIRFEPVTPDTRSHEHPPWLELQFNVVVH
jgi:hypothetical protein